MDRPLWSSRKLNSGILGPFQILCPAPVFCVRGLPPALPLSSWGPRGPFLFTLSWFGPSVLELIEPLWAIFEGIADPA